MRILVLSHEYPPVGGGGGRVAQDVCQGLARRGHEIQVLTAHWKGLPNQEIQSGVRITRLVSGRKEPYRASLAAMAGYILKAVLAAPRMIRRWQPDLIHVHFAVPAGAAAWLLARLFHLPYVLTAHGGDVPGGVPEKTGRWFRWVYPFTPPIWHAAARITAVSERTRLLAVQHYGVPVQVIPNGVDLVELDPGEIRVSSPPRVLFAGRFMPEKNMLMIVRALVGLGDLPWSCVLLGDGPLKGQVEQEISRLGMQARFTLPGWVTPQEVIAWFRQSDILFMPSFSESLSVVGVQAAALGLALVLSRVGGNLELVRSEENGFLCESSDEAGFQAALRSLLVDPQKLLAFRRASRLLAARFDISRVIDQYEQVLLEAVPAQKVGRR